VAAIDQTPPAEAGRLSAEERAGLELVRDLVADVLRYDAGGAAPSPSGYEAALADLALLRPLFDAVARRDEYPGADPGPAALAFYVRVAQLVRRWVNPQITPLTHKADLDAVVRVVRRRVGPGDADPAALRGAVVQVVRLHHPHWFDR